MRVRARIVLNGLALAALSDCLGPTEIVLELHTDVACDVVDANGVTIAVGVPGDDDGGVVAVTKSCADGSVGSLVLTLGEAVGLRVTLGVNAQTCTPPKYAGCIVARRSLRYSPHTPLTLPVDLDDAGGCSIHSCTLAPNILLFSCQLQTPLPSCSAVRAAADPTGLAYADVTSGKLTMRVQSQLFPSASRDRRPRSVHPARHSEPEATRHLERYRRKDRVACVVPQERARMSLTSRSTLLRETRQRSRSPSTVLRR